MNAAHLIEAAIKAHTVDGYTSHYMVADAHERAIRTLVAQLNELQGIGAKPQPGCHFREVSMGDLTVTVEFEAERAEASVSIQQVFLNGCWLDPSDFVAASVVERWEQEILDAQADDGADHEDRDDSRDDYLADRASDRLEHERDMRAAA